MDCQGFLKQIPGYATTAIHFGQNPGKWMSAALVPPIVTSSTFQFKTPTELQSTFEYGRLGNQTRDTLEEYLAALEGGKQCFTFASGLGAITTVVALFSKGDHIICIDDVFGGTYVLFKDIISRLGIDVSFVDMTIPEKLEKAMKENTKLIWIETPTNPSLKVVDIAATVKLVKSRGNIIVVVDNTFLTSYLQRPLDFGADIVVYSLTKYVNSHTDVIMGGAIVNDQVLADKLRFLQRSMGVVPSPFDCYLVIRSLKTLALRMERHKETALLLAQWMQMTHSNMPEEHRKEHGITHGLIRLSVGLEDRRDLIQDMEQAFKVAFECS